MSSKRSVQFTISSVAPATSDGQQLGAEVITGFFFPAAWTTSNISFEASYDGVNYFTVVKSDGTPFVLTACVASTFVALSPADMAWAGLFIRLVSVEAQTTKIVIANAIRTY